MQSKFPSVSVIIPVKNEANKIRACIDGILSQTVPVAEIIVIDSGSTDDTVSILRSYKEVTLIEIPGAEFNHGETRNLGISRASSEFVLLTVGDARPYNNYWIEELLNGFVDEEVAGVCGQQVIPHEPDKNPVEWFRPVDEPKLKRYQFEDVADFEALSPLEKKRVCGWDDVNAMYRRSVMLKLPYRKVSYAEDLLWCKDALLNGYAVVFNYASRVFHYHLENADFTYKRTFTVSYYRYKAFDYIPTVQPQSLRSKLSIVKLILFERSLSVNRKLYWLRYNFQNRNAIQNAVADFIAWQLKGDALLDEQHVKICGKPPVPLKSS